MRLEMNQNHRSAFPRNSKRASAYAAGVPRITESAVVEVATIRELSTAVVTVLSAKIAW